MNGRSGPPPRPSLRISAGCGKIISTNRDLWRYEYMAGAYYKPCKEFDICNELIEKYWESKQYDKCFEGHLVLAEQGYPLAECQIGYFYYEGLGVEKDLEKALYWTRRAAEHGDRDGQCNLAWFYEDAIGVERDIEQAKHWYRLRSVYKELHADHETGAADNK